MLKISYTGYLGLSAAISSQLAVEIDPVAKNCEKNLTKPSFGGVQGR